MKKEELGGYTPRLKERKNKWEATEDTFVDSGLYFSGADVGRNLA